MAEALLSQLRAQDTAKLTIERGLSSGRVHHAFLFTGPDGVGKELAAFGLAQALVCEQRKPDQAAACGTCSACTRTVPRGDDRRPVHPDVAVLQRALYSAEQIGRKNDEKQFLSVDQVRTLVLARAAYPPHEGRAKVFIIRAAEEMNDEAANTLLKTLEEPGPKTHFVLLTSKPQDLLPTILSRTLRVRFAPLPDDVVQALLTARGVAPARAKEVARLAGGSVEAGEMLADPDESEARDRFVAKALEAAASNKVEPTLALAEDAKKEKDRLPARIAALAAALAERAAEAAKTNGPEAETLANRGRHALTALEHLAGNGNPQLVVEAMLTRMRAV